MYPLATVARQSRLEPHSGVHNKNMMDTVRLQKGKATMNCSVIWKLSF